MTDDIKNTAKDLQETISKAASLAETLLKQIDPTEIIQGRVAEIQYDLEDLTAAAMAVQEVVEDYDG